MINENISPVDTETEIVEGPVPLVPVSATASPEEVEIARELVLPARDRGVALFGPKGLLKALTKTVIETVLDKLAEHLG